MKEFLLPPRRGVLPSEVEAEKLRRLAEARARRNRGPESGVMRPELPSGRAAHAEAAHDDAVLVNAVLPFHRVERFEQVCFTGELVGVAETPVEVQHDRVARREFTGFRLTV